MKKFLVAPILLCSALGLAQQKKQVLFTNKNQDKVACYRIPSIVKAPNGDLVAVVDERHTNCADLIDNKNINIAQRISKDGGKTWSPVETVIDFPQGQSASDPSMVVDEKTKEIFMFYNYMDHNLGRPRNESEFRFHYVKSSDNGKTWSEPVDITDQVAPADWNKDFKFITSGRGVYTKNGWILNTIVRLRDGVYVFGSKDHGKTWFRAPAVAKTADETNIVTLNNGDWMLNARVQNHGYRKIFLSSDLGNSWTERTEKQLEDPTCNASTLVVRGKKILFSNLHSQKHRANLGVKYSKDNGKTWNFVKTFDKGSTAYSVLTPIKGKEFGIIYEADGYKDIVFEEFKIK